MTPPHGVDTLFGFERTILQQPAPSRLRFSLLFNRFSTGGKTSSPLLHQESVKIDIFFHERSLFDVDLILLPLPLFRISSAAFQ